MATWETVRELAEELPEVEEGTGYGRPALSVGGKVFACIGREGDHVLAARVGFEERDHLLRTEPDVFFVTPHYANWPWVLVRLPDVDLDALRDVLTESWLFRAPQKLAASFEPPTS
jgi:hypothetical protein